MLSSFETGIGTTIHYNSRDMLKETKNIKLIQFIQFKLIYLSIFIYLLRVSFLFICLYQINVITTESIEPNIL